MVSNRLRPNKCVACLLRLRFGVVIKIEDRSEFDRGPQYLLVVVIVSIWVRREGESY